MFKITAILPILLHGTLFGFFLQRPALAETREPMTPSPFGIGACSRTNTDVEIYKKWIPQMAEIGIKTIRTVNTKWGTVEPEEGKWVWNGLTAQMDYLDSQHFDYGGLLLGNPAWNTKDPRGALPVNNLPAWSKYVSEVVKHCKGRIKYWEVWNEPPNFTAKNQTAEDYAKIVVAAYDAAKAADPDCLIGLAAKSVHVNFLEQAIEYGAKDHFDYITLHPYETLGGILRDKGTEALYMAIVPTVRQMLARVNPAKVDVPIIFTELGVNSGPPGKNHGMGPEMAAHGLVKAYTMGIAQGVTCINWFQGMDGDSGAMGLLDAAGKPRLNYTAMAEMIRHLGDRPTSLGWVRLNNKHYGFIFQGTKGPVLVTWAYKGIPDQIDFGPTAKIIDPLTGATTEGGNVELTRAPILVVYPPDDLVAQARANQNKPFPWGGDYSKAESVSITFGEQTVAKGLQTQSGDAVAADVLAYGGSARAGDVPGGNLFMIDPSFLSRESGPIRITAVVRRNEANDNAGFKLIYESSVQRGPQGDMPLRDGYKPAPGWFTVPDNKQWHTATWDLDDAQFVGKYGYHFSLSSEGNKLNKYFIQSVTVTKLPAGNPASTTAPKAR